MAIGLSDILSALQNGVTAIQKVSTQLAATFPQATTVSTTAPSTGTITFNSSQSIGFLTVTTSSGASYKVPLY